MEMVAAAEITNVGEDITPPLYPLSYSLHDAFLLSHCAACFSPLPNPSPHPHPLRYCSPSCSSSHSPLHLASACHHLHLSLNPFYGETSDLRVALLLLLQIKCHQPFKQYDRIRGLMTNHHMSIDDHEFSSRIKRGARAMAAATMMRDGVVDSDSSEGYLLEEAVLCLVVTNAVEVQDRVGRAVGIAVYDIHFSWINHSCTPNARYRFLLPESHGGGKRCLITPASSNGSEPIDFSTNSDFQTGHCGPRIVVRSIKPIKKGEQVTIAYTDLLQPKELRQLELWSKYRFTCCCPRCVVLPLTYVDQCLQELSSSNGRLFHDVGVENFIDDAIGDYLSSNDAESCCEKLENVLLNGICYGGLIIRLHSQHHLSLNAYTTLASAYKVRAMDEKPSNALKMNRFGAAYSFLLAAFTHDLFLSESSLIDSVSNFWIGAGESLVNLARSLASNSASALQSCKCSRCGLIDIFEADGECPNKILDISKEFLSCITDITPEMWKYLADGNSCLEGVKDLRWVEFAVEREARVEAVLGVGIHCLLYGGILSNISGGVDSHSSCFVRRLVHDEVGN